MLTGAGFYGIILYLDQMKGNFYINAILTFLGNLINPVDTPLAIGPKIIPFNYVINAQKTGTIVIMFLLMVCYNNFSLGAWIYLSLHGTYGLIWFMKDMIFPDKSFQVKLTIPGAIMTVFLLLLYWIIGFEMMSGIGDQNPSPRKIFSCFFIFSFGSLLIMLTDFQKFIELKYKKGLIDDEPTVPDDGGESGGESSGSEGGESGGGESGGSEGGESGGGESGGSEGGDSTE